MEESVRDHTESRQPATVSQADATVHITTRSPAPSSDIAANIVTSKHQGSCFCQQNFTLASEVKLPAFAHPLHTADASQSPAAAAVEVAADNTDIDLQHMSTSDLQDLFQGWNSLSSQDVVGTTAASDGPALAGRAQQQESGIVIDDAETMFHFADQASTGVSMSHCTAVPDIACNSSSLFEPPDLMDTSTGCSEHEASLCCHLDCVCCQICCCKCTMLTYKVS